MKRVGARDVVCAFIVQQEGKRRRVFLARKDDPVRALDNLFGGGTITPTTLESISCNPTVPDAVTSRGAQAVAEILASVLLRPPPAIRVSPARKSRA